MAQRVGGVESFAVSAKIQIARIGPLQIGVSRRHFRDLSKERSRVYSKYVDGVFESISDIKSRTVRIEECLFAIETSLKVAYDRIIRSVDHTGKVGILI